MFFTREPNRTKVCNEFAIHVLAHFIYFVCELVRDVVAVFTAADRLCDLWVGEGSYCS